MGFLDFFRIKPKEPAPAPPKGEVSFTDSQLFTSHNLSPYNPDIFVRTKGGLAVYDKMRRDEMVISSQLLKKLAVLCSGWSIEPASEDAGDKEVAKFVDDALRRIPGTLEEKLKEILTAFDYGFSVTEKVFFEISDGDFEGKLGLKLKTRKPHPWEFETDPFGNLKPMGLWQNNGQYKYDPKRFVVYSHNREFDNWYGKSDLQAAYRSWWSKDVLIKFWNIYLERYGQGGIPMLHGKDGKQVNASVYSTLKEALANLQTRSVLAWDTDDAVVELLELQGKGQGEHERAIRYHDRAIGRALLMPTGLGFSEDEKSGSKARSETHFNMWLWVMTDLRRIVEETIIQEQIIDDLVLFNYGRGVARPKFAFNPFNNGEEVALAEMWLKAIEGQAVHVNANDEQHFRAIVQFPERDQEELEAEFEEDKKRGEEDRQARNSGLGRSVAGNDEPEGEGKAKGPKVPAKPKGGADAEKEEGTEGTLRSSARSWHRKLNKFEKRVDFSRIETSLDEIEATAKASLIEVLKRQRDKFLDTFTKVAEKKAISMNWITSLDLQYGVEYAATFKEFMRTAFEAGRRDARGELAQAKTKELEAHYVFKLPPAASILQLEKSAFWIKNVTFDSLVKSIQALLINAHETGETPIETAAKIRTAYEPFIGDAQAVRDQRQIEPYRIETVVRTNSTKAYNRGRLVEFADPELEGFVQAVELSAILDMRTTDICRAADGKIVRMDDEQNVKRLTPPLHHNCRSILVPVTLNDGEFEPTKQAELAQIKGLMPANFGGDVDK